MNIFLLKISNYKIFKLENNKWINIDNKNNNIVCINNNNISEKNIIFNKKNYKGFISIYKTPINDDIEIKTLKDNYNFLINFYLCSKKLQILINLLSRNYKRYLKITEKIFITFQNLIYSFSQESAIYINGNYIINNYYLDYEYIKDYLNIIDFYDALEFIYIIIGIVGNKIYTDYDKILLFKIICDRCNIEYEIFENPSYIEVFIINNIKYVKDEEYEGELYFPCCVGKILTKIGKYALFL